MTETSIQSAAQDTPQPPLRMQGAAQIVVSVLGGFGLVGIVLQTFNLPLFGIFPLLSNRYYYCLIALFLAASFLLIPARANTPESPISALDWLLAALALGSGSYLALHAEAIITQGWDVVAPRVAALTSILMVLLALESLRRSSGSLLLLICAFFAAYPLFAEYMPGFLWGPSLTLEETAAAHVMGMESLIGIPLRVVADTLVGFIIFGTVLNAIGGARFFMELSMALMGQRRGGSAKVAILSSALFGSQSGSVISNVLSTGRMTISAMKNAGFPSRYAGAVEACASTGGTLMPPVMGAVAFIMASFLDMPYTRIIVAAIVPSALYYFALLLQVDLFAARNGLSTPSDQQMPVLRAVILQGWHHLISLAALVLLLFVISRARAAYYATALMLLFSLVRYAVSQASGAGRSAGFDRVRDQGHCLSDRHALRRRSGGRLAGDHRRRRGLLARTGAIWRAKHAAAFGPLRHHQLCPGHGDDRVGLLHLPCDHPRPGPRRARAVTDRLAPFCAVLGDALLHHTAGRTGVDLGGADRRSAGHGDGLYFHAAWRGTVHPAVRFRLGTCATASGQRSACHRAGHRQCCPGADRAGCRDCFHATPPHRGVRA